MAFTGLTATGDGDPLLKRMAWVILAPSILIYIPRLGSIAFVEPNPEGLFFTAAGYTDFYPLYLTVLLFITCPALWSLGLS